MTIALRVADLRRLAFIKYVLGLGREHSHDAEPNCAVALLHLHDGTELLLQLAAEKLDAVVDRSTPFLGYWAVLSKALGRDLPFHGAMKRLNEARVALKHHGHLPGRAQVADFADVVEEFVGAVSPLVFGVPWEAISRADFVRSERARSCLKEAEKAFAVDDYRTCQVECRKVYETLLTEYSPFEGSRPDMGMDLRLQTMELNASLREFVDWVSMEFYAVHRELAGLAIGLDPRRVANFLHLTPSVAHSANWRWHVVETTWQTEPSSDSARKCLDFVLDAASKIEAGPYAEVEGAV